MPRKKAKQIDSGDEGEWIMSYADTVTLLLCFFVIFFSQSKMIGETEEDKPEEVVLEIIPEEKIIEEIEEIEKLKKQIVVALEEQDIKGVEVQRKENEVIIRLSAKEFFNVGSFKLIKNGESSLKKLATSLKLIIEDFEVYVEGHTDSKPVRGSVHYRSNLGLSSLRASTAAEVLTSSGLDKQRVRVMGYGDSKPVAKDRVIASETNEVKYLEEESRLNRRVELRLVYLKKDKK